jgi:methionine-rich copper-binding protein CopC/type III secretion system FlhB-like substrate exporter
MATYTLTGTTGNDTKSFTNAGGQPSSGNVYNIDLLAGSDTFRFDEGSTGKYIGRFLSTGFTIGAAVNGVITVTGASTGGMQLTLNFTNVETLVFGDKSVTLTYAPADTTPPTVSTFSPADASTSVAETSDIVVTFSESIQKGTGTIEIRSGSSTGTLFESYDSATNTSNLTFSGSTLTINPTGTLASNTHYFVVLPSGSVKDLAGNSYAGTSTYDFTTGDNISPVFSSGSTGSVDENAAISTVVYTAAATDAGGSTVTYSLSGTDAALLSINSSTGAVTLKASADYETKSSYSFNVVASDGIAAHNVTKAVTVSVNNLNDNSPVFTSGAIGSVDENAATTTVIYTAAATDADNLGALTYSLSGTDASLLNIDSSTGAVTLKSSADYETKTSYSFSVTASDGLAAHDATKAVTVSVNNLNDNVPVFTSGATGTVVNKSAAGTVIYAAVATDADNLGALTYSLTGTDATALNIDSANGQVSLKTAVDYATRQSFSFNVVASDGSNTTSKAIAVNVQQTNDFAPVFTSVSTGSVDENAATSTVVYTAAATDADGNPLSFSLSGTDAALLNINASTGAVTLKASADYETKTSYSFDVKVSDGLAAHDTTKAVTVSVNNLNDNSPVFTSGSTEAVDENAATSTVVYTAAATDADGNTLTYSLSGTDAALLNINSSSGAVTLKSSADYETKTSYSFDVKVSDGLAAHDTTKAVTISVNNLNDNSPVFTSGGTGIVAENAPVTTVVYTAAATDADGNTVTYSLSGTDASLLTIDTATGAVTLKTSADYETKTSYSFNVTASDGLAAHDASKAVVVSVTNLNDNAPIFTSGGTGAVSDKNPAGTLIYTAVATDADGNTLTYSLNGTDASLLIIDTSNGRVTLKAAADYAVKPSYSFSVAASDGVNTVTKSVVVSVQVVNDFAPVWTSGTTAAVAENSAVTTPIYTAAATDADGNTLTYSLGGSDANLLNIDGSTGAVTLKVAADYETKTSYSFSVTANDGLSAHDITRAVTLSVTNLNDNKPVFSSGSTGSVDENVAAGTVVYTAAATDADNLGAVNYSLSGTDASLLNINSTTGEVSLKASPDYEVKTSYNFNVTASDGTSSNDVTKSVVVSVVNLNDNAPLFTSGATASIDENSPLATPVYTASATDADGNTLTYSLGGSDAALLNIDSATGSVTLKSNADYETKTSYSFSVTASDGLVAHDVTKAVTLNIVNTNDNAPLFTSGGNGTVVENAPASTVVYTAAATDADNLGPLTYSLSGTDAGLVDINASTGAVTLKASADYETKSSYSFNVVAGDGLNTTTQAVSVSVQNVDEPPTTTDDTVATHAGTNQVLVIDNFGVYNDPEKVPLASVKITTLPAAASGQLLYSPDGTTWNAVTTNQQISSAEISLGHLKFVSTANMVSDTIGFIVSDGTLESDAHILTLYAEQVQTVAAGTTSSITGTGLTATVPAAMTLFSDSLPTNDLSLHDRIVSMTDQEVVDPTLYALVESAIGNYTAGLSTSQQSAVTVKELELIAGAGFDAANSITISGDATGNEAVIIDGSHQPTTLKLTLDNVEFAVIIGASHIDGGAGSNNVVADGSNQYIVLGAEDDTIRGGAGDDTVGSQAGNDMVYGDAGNDSVFGGAGNDSLYGGDGNDTLHGDAGNDHIDGGAGDDTAIFSGVFSNYAIRFDQVTDTYTVTDITGADGIDTVTGVEHFQFSDVTKSPASSVDSTAPTVVSFTPTSSATGVAVTDNIVLKFSEPVQRGTGAIVLHKDTAAGATIESFDVATSALVSISGDTLTINPTANLANGTDYYMTFGSGTIKDYALNDYSGTTAYHFSTVAAAAAVNNGGSGGDAGVVVAGVAGVGLLAWLLL